MKTTVIHHSADYDGIFCREIARKFLPDAEPIGWDFKDKPLSLDLINQSQSIYILDLPVDRPFGVSFPDALNQFEIAGWLDGRIIWIDHHKSSIESHPKDIKGYRIDGVAACRLAWQWFNRPKDDEAYPIIALKKEDYVNRTVSEPLAVRLAGEYDIWDKRDERADVFQFGLRSRELTAADWTDLLSGCDIFTEGLLSNGKMLQSYQQRNDAGMMGRSFLVEFEGLKLLALTTARCNSLTFAAKDVPETGHDALMGFYFDGKKWNVSLYHAKHNTGIDLSQIAVKYGGGGHRGACGFQVESLPFIK
jgi:oligoribonuclease NrnB/cAMP/cGMP phosphodiesterase (DHH superfamily)